MIKFIYFNRYLNKIMIKIISKQNYYRIKIKIRT